MKLSAINGVPAIYCVLVIACIFLTILSVSHRADASTQENLLKDHFGVWAETGHSIKYTIDDTFPGEEERIAIMNAFKTWSAVTEGLKFEFQKYNNETLDTPSDVVLVTRQPRDQLKGIYAQVLKDTSNGCNRAAAFPMCEALGTPAHLCQLGEMSLITRGTIVFLDAPKYADLGFFCFPAAWSLGSFVEPGFYDLESAVLHEVGHIAGLPHPNYSPGSQRAEGTVLGALLTGTKERDLFEADKAAIRLLYAKSATMQWSSTVVAGDTLSRSGSGFPPYHWVTIHTVNTETNEEEIETVTTSSEGTFTDLYWGSSTQSPVWYKWWATDKVTGKQSGEPLVFQVVPSNSSEYASWNLQQKFQQAYLGSTIMGSPINDIHLWNRYWVQDYPDTSGFGRSIMIYNPKLENVFIVHGDIWSQVYEPRGGVTSWLGLPTSNESSSPVSDSLNNVRQNFEHGYITHRAGSDPWWQPYPYSSQAATPTVAQTDTGSYPPRFSPGSTFRQWGTGFTPNSTAVLHFLKPDGTEYPSLSWSTDADGTFDLPYTIPVDKPAGTYTWWGVDASSGKVSGTIAYSVDSSPAAAKAITLLSPNGGQRLYEGTEDYPIYWTSNGTVEKVRVELWKKDRKIQTLTDNLDGNSTLNDGNFHWDIRHIDDFSDDYKIKLVACDFVDNVTTCHSGINDYSDYDFTIVRKAPEKASSPNVPSGSTDIPLAATLNWARISDATSYDVYFGPAGSLYYRGNQTFTTFNPGPLAANTAYYWRVDTKNEGGTTNGSTWHFTTIPGARIAGTVTDEKGAGIPNITVKAFNSSLVVAGEATTDASGNYTISVGLNTGNYRVGFFDPSQRYVTVFYPNFSTLRDATLFAAIQNEVTGGINAAMELGGSLAGRVTDTSGRGLSGVTVQLCGADGAYTDYLRTVTDSSGNYALAAVKAGSYKVLFDDFIAGFYSRYYPDATSSSDAASVTVTALATRSDVNAVLELGGSISGRVSDASGNPLQAVYVVAWLGGSIPSVTYTDADGRYTLRALPSGSYNVSFDASSQNYGIRSVSQVTVTAPLATPGIDATLYRGGWISGRVTDSSGKTLSQIQVSIYDRNGKYLEQAQTYPGGTYTTPTLEPGDYKISFDDRTYGKYQSQYYNDAASQADATVVHVSETTVTTADAVMKESGSISGKLTDPTGKGIANVAVILIDFNTSDNIYRQVTRTSTGADGSYSIGGVATGTYRVEFDGADAGYVIEYYDDVADLSATKPIQVTAGSVTIGIDAVLTLGGSISGRVTDSSGQGLANIPVVCYSPTQPLALTASDGTYTIKGVPAGSFSVYFNGEYTGYGSKYYSSAVIVSSGAVTSGIDAVMELGGSISGKVTTTAGVPLSKVWISTTNIDTGAYGGGGVSMNDGSYTVSGLVPGNYKVSFNNNIGYITQYYNNTKDYSAAASVHVSPGVVTPNINAVLKLGGSISGRVTDAAGSGIANIQVIVHTSGFGYATSAKTASDGTYTANGLEEGSYTVYVSTEGTPFISQYYKHATTLTDATPVAVSYGAVTPNIDDVLETGGAISGKVTDTEGRGIPGITVALYGDAGNGTATTTTDGSYTLSGARPGRYKVAFYGTDYFTKFYGNATEESLATEVTVTTANVTSGIDAVLQKGGSITGRVTDASGAGISNVSVSAISLSGDTYWGSSDGSGNFTVKPLPSDNYVVQFHGNWSGYVTEYYNDSLQIEGAVKIAVTAPNAVLGINAALAKGGTVTGHITDERGLPIPWISVTAYDLSDNYLSGGYSDENGTYSISGMPSGRYRIYFEGYSQGYVSRYFSDRSGVGGITPVVVSAPNQTGNIDATLLMGRTIAGTITDAAGTGLPNVYVVVLDASGWVVSGAMTDAQGRYAAGGIPAGIYKIYFLDTSWRNAGQWYRNKGSFAVAEWVAVTATADTSGIDGSLGTGVNVVAFPPRKDYGDVFTGSTWYRTFTVSNYGTLPATVGSITLSGKDSVEFMLEDEGCFGYILAPGGYCTFRVVLSPATAGPKSATVTVAVSDPLLTALEIPVSGTAVPPTAVLSLSFAGSGGGTVYSTPPGIACNTKSSAVFDGGTVVTLSQTPSIHSSFTAWSGACIGSGACEVTMNANKDVTATFTADPGIVRINSDNHPYYTIGSTIGAITTSGITISAKAEKFPEDVILNSPLGIVLKGGFTDDQFSLRSAGSVTVIDGSLKIRRGTLRVERLVVR